MIVVVELSQSSGFSFWRTGTKTKLLIVHQSTLKAEVPG